MKIFKRLGYWVGLLLYYIGIVLAIGTVTGSCLFGLLGSFFVDLSYWELMKKGAWIGFRYAGVWAGGIGITLCVLKAGRRKAVYGR